MKSIKELAIVIASSVFLSSVLTVYFGWRSRFLSSIRKGIDAFEDGVVHFKK